MRENIHDNLFGAHPPDLFQIDANLGFTTAICEMLIQEIDGVIRLLPALPNTLPSGSISGVKLHGGHTISLCWKEFRLVRAEVEAARDGEIVIAGTYLSGDTATYRDQEGNTHLSLQAGARYQFACG